MGGGAEVKILGEGGMLAGGGMTTVGESTGGTTSR